MSGTWPSAEMPLRVFALEIVGREGEGCWWQPQGTAASPLAQPCTTGHFATAADVGDAGGRGMLGHREGYPAERSTWHVVVVVAEQRVIGAPHPQGWAAARRGLTTAGFPGKNNSMAETFTGGRV